MRPDISLLAGLLLLVTTAYSDPTWPAATDEIEELMYQLYGFGARLFADNITPCSKESMGLGRQTASEWLRVAFHDMSTANTFFGIGGIDASIMYELNDGENTGPGHNTSLLTYANFFSPRSSMSDLIALGAALSTRVCGGPVVPLKGGRVDATSAGSPGVPQPQNPISTFISQFSRMGFNATEMIALVACGHTLGGVHTPEFPLLVPPGTAANNESGLDSTVSAFDNAVVREYLDGSTTNPLVVGPSVALKQNADFLVFNSDGNTTMKTLADPTAFSNTCASLLQRMIEVVPAGVVLSDIITPYAVKPVDMQLTLNTGGTALLLSGNIRVRTTGLAQNITGITLTYKDRSGASCSSCSVDSTVQGVGSGLDDSFNFFPISASIHVSSGISSFTITLQFEDGTTQLYDNNGNSYPMSDAVMIQQPQSCLVQGSGALTVSTLVRNNRTSLPVNMTIWYQTPQIGIPGPKLQSTTMALAQGDCVGSYTFYSATYNIPGGLSYAAKLDITSGSGTDAVSDSFNAASDLPGTCLPFSGGATCDDVSITSSVMSSTSSGVVSSSTAIVTSSPTSQTSSTLVTSTTSASPTASLSHKASVGGYNLVSCWNEGIGVRALSDAAFAYDGMTLETCLGNCSNFAYWGTEYGRECYCGNALAASSTSAPLADCNFVCGGDSLEYCGAGNRLELYLTTASSLPSSTSTSNSIATSNTISSTSGISSSAAPTATLGVRPTVGKYSFVGCWTEATGIRALSASTYTDDAMTLESCASFCASYKFFGTEYGRECYCGDTLDASSASAPLDDCNFVCAGNPLEYCGAGDRLELYSDIA